MGSAEYFYPLARVREQVEALQGLRQGHTAALAGAPKQRCRYLWPLWPNVKVRVCAHPLVQRRVTSREQRASLAEPTRNIRLAEGQQMQSRSHKLHKGCLSWKILRPKWPFHLLYLVCKDSVFLQVNSFKPNNLF